MNAIDSFRSTPFRLLIGALAVAGVTACSGPPPGADFLDPYEAGNREVHATNVAFDRMLFSDVDTETARSAGPQTSLVGNFAENASLPRRAVNNLLQLRPDRAIENILRFAVNSTLGFGGLFDPAADFGLTGHIGDFGQTMHVWGFSEGAFVVLPVIGPSTERDTFGMLVDLALDPVQFVIPAREAQAVTGMRLLGLFGDRAAHAEVVEFTLHQSADSYAQTRLMYLQNRRFELGQDPQMEYIDPYELFD